MCLKLPAWPVRGMMFMLLALAFVRGLIYVSFVPPWQHYDEPGHFEYVEYIARHHRLPTDDTVDVALRREIVTSMQRYRFSTYQSAWQLPSDKDLLTSLNAVPLTQFRHPPLYYLLGAAVLTALPSQELEVHLYALRLMSVVFNLLFLLVAAFTIRQLLPGKDEVLYGALAFIIFLPAYSDMSTAVNNDVLANLLFTGLVYLLVRQIVEGTSWQQGLATACVFALCLLTKRTTAVGGFAILAAILMLSKQQGRRYFGIAMAVMLLLGLLAGILIFDWQAGQGLALSPRLALYLYLGPLPSLMDSLLNWERSWPIYRVTVPLLFKGFWGHFAWGAEAFTGPIYCLLLIITVAALAGVIRLLIGSHSNALCLNVRQKQGLWLLLLTLATVWLATLLRVHPINPTGWTYLPRARYAYVAIVPAAILFVIGLRAWIPARRRDWLVIGLAVGGVLLDTLFLAGYLLPFYLG